MRFCASLLSTAVFLLAGCGQQGPVDYGFAINNVSVSTAYQSLNVHMQQQLELSQQARDALLHGVTLTINLEIELRSDSDRIVIHQVDRYYQLRYLPLSERYQLSEDQPGELQAFPRLRHLLAAIGDLNIHLATGPLLPGIYELRTRIRLDESRLPTPMQLPAWFSADWQHDSRWSVWPFEVSV